MKTFVTIFEKCENIHLIKDVGQIPYLMYKNHGYDASIVCVENSDSYLYLEDEVKGLKLQFIPKVKLGRVSLATLWYLLFNAKKIDVLHLFHHREPTYIYSIIYKKLNPNGHLYIKSDKGYRDIINNGGFFSQGKKRHQKREKLFNKALKYIDTISVENEGSYEFLVKKYPKEKEKFFYLTNALNIEEFYKKTPLLPYSEKENIILTVGRIGAKEKNNQMLLDVIAKIDLNDWKVVFIGPIAPDFQENIDMFYSQKPDLKDSVMFTGAIQKRKELFEYYAKAKLFCLTSKEESFGFVLIEAMSYGNYVITTDVSSARDITMNEKYGKIIGNENELSLTIESIIKDESTPRLLSKTISNYASSRYNWSTVLNILASRF